ncbi:MAG: hypothetical protein R2911_02025 [Caldilineaceae bacterium]
MKIEISAGTTCPIIGWVRALYSLQNPIMLTPCDKRGAYGRRWIRFLPAGIWSLTCF